MRACALTDIPEVGAVGVEIDGVPVAVVRSEGEVHAIYNVCSHEEVALSEGDVEDGEIECWLHGSRFDLRNGEPTGLPATEPVPVYPVRVEDGDVLVDVRHPIIEGAATP
ncbi:MAG TPA: non-heme iron oxygenase ferredoxin subunit [Actinopolymorphaceae bacterium]